MLLFFKISRIPFSGRTSVQKYFSRLDQVATFDRLENKLVLMLKSWNTIAEDFVAALVKYVFVPKFLQ